jgi:hypothetical protein
MKFHAKDIAELVSKIGPFNGSVSDTINTLQNAGVEVQSEDEHENAITYLAIACMDTNGVHVTDNWAEANSVNTPSQQTTINRQRTIILAMRTVQQFSKLLESNERWGYILQDGTPEAMADNLLCYYFDDSWLHCEDMIGPDDTLQVYLHGMRDIHA